MVTSNNRTFVELKLKITILSNRRNFSNNRTFVELKQLIKRE